jgi:hypothetical protein
MKFGRLVSPIDKRDEGYPLALLLSPVVRKTARRQRQWADYWQGDQGRTSQCVAYAGLNYLADGPVRHPDKPDPIIAPATLYKECQAIDGYPLPHDGTTVRALAKVLKQRGLISGYYWGKSTTLTTQVLPYLLEVGPLVIGIRWYEGMMKTDAKGLIKPTGQLLGGHAVEIGGVDLDAELLDGECAWGTSWGLNGHFKIKITDFRKLLADNGECLVATEVGQRMEARR